MKGSCAGPRVVNMAADGGCDDFGDDSGGSVILHGPNLRPGHRGRDPPLTHNWEAPLSSEFSGPCPLGQVEKRIQERMWNP